jgi:hypothetical protein
VTDYARLALLAVLRGRWLGGLLEVAAHVELAYRAWMTAREQPEPPNPPYA